MVLEGMYADDKRNDADLLHAMKSCLQTGTPPCLGRPNHRVYGGEGVADLRVVISEIPIPRLVVMVLRSHLRVYSREFFGNQGC